MVRCLLLVPVLLLVLVDGVTGCAEERGPIPDYCWDRGSACGCSEYRKAECESDECCQWFVGDGCSCGPQN